ncbi:MAG: hypothetical protein ACPGQV_21985 [Alphaproteobacteria bacterium]
MTILGDDIVMYRRADRSLVALEDASTNRKLPLSMGRLMGPVLTWTRPPSRGKF